MTDLAAALTAARAETERQLSALIPTTSRPHGRVVEAMRYSALGAGKRLRPFLLLQCARLFDVDEAQALRAAAAVEMVHCYSLVHDDLPAMDDDDMRRGRPATHVKFDEATAILAGNALLTLAFEVLAAPATHPDASVRNELVLALTAAAGRDGIIGGQMIDLGAEGRALDLDQITELQAMKTGAMIAVSCAAGAILGRAPSEARQALSRYADNLGLAFQITDDLLDVEGDEAEAGKGVGKDAEFGKATIVSLLGIEVARSRAGALVDEAIGHLAQFGERADLLRATARFVLARRH